MDLNYLLHRQQVERARAEAALTDEAAAAHVELAERYEAAIEEATSDDFAIASLESAGNERLDENA